MILWLLILLSWFPTDHTSDGTYKSVAPSYRENFFLVVETPNVTLYGWEISPAKDTVYFRATTVDTASYLVFDGFDFQKTPVTEKNIRDFKPQNIEGIDPVFLHKYWHKTESEKGNIELRAVKNAYDSRADAFYFEKVNQ